MAASDVDSLTRGLIGGMEIRQFNAEIREKRAAKFPDAINPEQLEHLCSLSGLESLFRREVISILNVDVFDDGHLRRLSDIRKKSGKSSLAVVADNFRTGSTIRVRDLDAFDARLNQFVGEIQRRFSAQSQINVYLTPPNKAGFPPHFDITDVFILQCLGRKEWKLFPDYSNRTELPVAETNWDPDRFQPLAPAEAVTLQPGDVLYMPRGVMHEAFCTERESMHLTISLVPLTFADLLAKALKSAAEADVELRRRVPWPTESGNGGLEELAAQVRERLGKLGDQIDVGALLKTELGSLQAEPDAGSSGELESAVASLVAGAGSNPSGGSGTRAN